MEEMEENTIRRYECSDCFLSFDTSYKFAAHDCPSSTTTVVKCDRQCTDAVREFSSRHTYLSHFIKCHIREHPHYTCKLCAIKYKEKDGRMEHIDAHGTNEHGKMRQMRMIDEPCDSSPEPAAAVQQRDAAAPAASAVDVVDAVKDEDDVTASVAEQGRSEAAPAAPTAPTETSLLEPQCSGSINGSMKRTMLEDLSNGSEPKRVRTVSGGFGTRFVAVHDPFPSSSNGSPTASAGPSEHLSSPTPAISATDPTAPAPLPVALSQPGEMEDRGVPGPSSIPALPTFLSPHLLPFSHPALETPISSSSTQAHTVPTSVPFSDPVWQQNPMKHFTAASFPYAIRNEQTAGPPPAPVLVEVKEEPMDPTLATHTAAATQPTLRIDPKPFINAFSMFMHTPAAQDAVAAVAAAGSTTATVVAAAAADAIAAMEAAVVEPAADEPNEHMGDDSDTDSITGGTEEAPLEEKAVNDRLMEAVKSALSEAQTRMRSTAFDSRPNEVIEALRQQLLPSSSSSPNEHEASSTAADAAMAPTLQETPSADILDVPLIIGSRAAIPVYAAAAQKSAVHDDTRYGADYDEFDFISDDDEDLENDDEYKTNVRVPRNHRPKNTRSAARKKTARKEVKEEEGEEELVVHHPDAQTGVWISMERERQDAIDGQPVQQPAESSNDGGVVKGSKAKHVTWSIKKELREQPSTSSDDGGVMKTPTSRRKRQFSIESSDEEVEPIQRRQSPRKQIEPAHCQQPAVDDGVNIVDTAGPSTRRQSPRKQIKTEPVLASSDDGAVKAPRSRHASVESSDDKQESTVNFTRQSPRTQMTAERPTTVVKRERLSASRSTSRVGSVSIDGQPGETNPTPKPDRRKRSVVVKKEEMEEEDRKFAIQISQRSPSKRLSIKAEPMEGEGEQDEDQAFWNGQSASNECPKCGETISKGERKAHYKTLHYDTLYRDTPVLKDLDRWVSARLGTKEGGRVCLQCSDATQQFKDRRSLVMHIKKEHKEYCKGLKESYRLQSRTRRHHEYDLSIHNVLN